MVMITIYKVAESPWLPGNKKKPLPQDGVLQGWPPPDEGTNGRQTLPPRWRPVQTALRPKRQRQRWQTSLGPSPPRGTETREGRSLQSSSGARWGCWHCLGAPALWCQPPQFLVVAMVKCVHVWDQCCCSLNSTGVGARVTASSRGGRKRISQAPWNGSLAPTYSTLGTGGVKFTLKQFWIAKCSLSGCCCCYADSCLKQTPPEPSEKLKKASALHCSTFPVRAKEKCKRFLPEWPWR